MSAFARRSGAFFMDLPLLREGMPVARSYRSGAQFRLAS